MVKHGLEPLGKSKPVFTLVKILKFKQLTINK